MPHWTLVLKAVWTAGNWLVAVAWASRAAYWRLHVEQVPSLLDARFAASTAERLTVVVPACNEAPSIRKSIESLLRSEGVDLEILAVDDRSTDATGAILDQLATESPQAQTRLTVIHIAELPTGWTGKPHAMSVAAARATGDWLLFTDADVLFREDALRRALAFMVEERADHLVLLPTPVCKTPGERMMLSFLSTMVIWGPRPWKVPDGNAKRDSIGIGAFNLVRASAYRAIGGWERLRMEVLEDVRLGFVLKQAGFAQRVATGRDLVSIRWAEGARGVVRNLTKNMFAVFRFRTGLMLAACAGLAVLCLLPFASLLGGAYLHLPSLWAAGVLSLGALLILYRLNSRNTAMSSLYVVLFPVAAGIFIFSLLRSAALTLMRGGVVWRGTFYPVDELRKHAGPLR